MASEPKGLMYVPVWVDGGIVKALVLDTGALPVTETDPVTAVTATLGATDITLKVSEQTPLTAINATLLTTAITLKVSEQTPLTSIQAQGYGYTGAAWKKQGMIWSFYDTLFDILQENSDVAATFQMELTPVPAGEVWYVLGVGMYRSVNISAANQVQIYNGTIAIGLETVDIPVIGRIYTNTNPIVLKATQYVIGRFAAATVGETCILTAWGYKMKVDM